MKAKNLSRIALAVALAVPAIAAAESNFVTGAATATGANARLDFRIIIPSVLYLAVGTSNLPALTNNTTVDLVDFGTIATPGSGAVAATSGPVSVAIRGNNGNISLTANHVGPGGLWDGASEYISMTTITATSSGSIGHPTFVDNGASTPVVVTPNVGTKITNRTDTWTFSYANATIPAAGTYGTAANQGRVTYTATMP
ncbi:MAG: hypothetical protein KJ007_15890 [Burkholderiales bacterium]|nr:hypothetical protein [Burkholderiales bacterium]